MKMKKRNEVEITDTNTWFTQKILSEWQDWRAA